MSFEVAGIYFHSLTIDSNCRNCLCLRKSEAQGSVASPISCCLMNELWSFQHAAWSVPGLCLESSFFPRLPCTQLWRTCYRREFISSWISAWSVISNFCGLHCSLEHEMSLRSCTTTTSNTTRPSMKERKDIQPRPYHRSTVTWDTVQRLHGSEP